MIKSVQCPETGRLFRGLFFRLFPQMIQRSVARKLDMLAAVVTLESLRVPGANCLEQMKGEQSGQCSIRINDQWRVCFRWQDGDAYDVEIVDYH